MPNTRYEWSPERTEYMLELWSTDRLSASKVAANMFRKFGEPITRNAVIGKAGRLLTTRKPSPIKNKSPSAKQKRYNNTDTRAALATTENKEPAKGLETNIHTPLMANAILAPGTCLYPMWGKTETSGKNCGLPRVISRNGRPSPYCREHYNICFVKKGVRRNGWLAP